MTESIENILSAVVDQGKALGFDLLEAAYVRRHLLGIRVANNTVCRENVLQERAELNLHGVWQSRAGRKSIPWGDGKEALVALSELQQELAAGNADPETVLPKQRVEQIGDGVDGAHLFDHINLGQVYQAIGQGAKLVQAGGLRLTGYVEIQKQDIIKISSGGLKESNSDAGAQISFTVDHLGQGNSGVGKRAVGFESLKDGLETAISEAIADGMKYGSIDLPRQEIAPGDYDVILTPSAVYDILKTKLFYGFWDRRKIDEGRTYLSQHREELAFDPGLQLTIDPHAPKTGLAVDPAVNSRGVACDPMTLIKDGRVRDQFTSGFWGQKTGIPETFEPQFLPAIQLGSNPGVAGSKIDRYADLEAMIAETQRGLLVVDTWYLRLVTEMNGVITGMTRDGLFLIEEGQIVAPLGHLRWHENPFGVLQRIDAMTADRHLCGLPRRAGQARGSSALLPAVRVKDFHFSSATKF